MKKLVIPCIIALCATGCASTQYLSQQEITSRFESVAQLQQAMSNAESANLKLLSPKMYKKAQDSLDESLALAKQGDTNATKKAQKGLAALESAQVNGEKARDMLSGALAAREKAEQAGAQNAMKNSYKEADKDLASLSRAVENGDFARVREERTDLEKSFRKLELKALKQDIIESAQKSFRTAKELDAPRYAPKTYKQAEEEMRLALNILEVNRGATDEAEKYAERALWWSERSIAVTETVKNFKQGDYSQEDIVLWYQDQFSSVMAPTGQALPLNYDHKRLMSSMRSDLENLVADKEQLVTENQALTAQSENIASAGLQKQMEMESQLTQTREQAQESDRKFALIQSLFDEKEALVFRQQNTVLLRTQGFDFMVGKSEIDSSNFALLQKIIRAIDEYPAAQIAVSGFTDSVGAAGANLKLSEDRAQKVAEFLVKVGQIDETRVSFKGHGETKPIASNETKNGRAENRRVEITLTN